MLPVFLLIGIEKIINLALATDPITQAGLTPLAGKVMRLKMREPNIEFDTIFNDDHVRFEPVPKLHSSVFEPKGTDLKNDIVKADCTVTVQNPSDLMRLLGEPEGNLPIEGDYKILMQVKTLVAGFEPDIAGKLQPIIGLSLASQLAGILANLKNVVGNPAKPLFDPLFKTAQNHAEMPSTKERDELKQELLKLRADIEREQARLEAIKKEQANLQGD